MSRTLPLAQETLRLAESKFKGQTLDQETETAIGPVFSRCKEKAKKLQDVFEIVENGAKNAKDKPVLEFYRSSLLRLGKAHRVEKLMQDILRDLNTLAINQVFMPATPSMETELHEAINQLSRVVSSVPDSEFNAPGINAAQNNASGATGHQTVISGQGHQINSGSGRQYNAQTMNFGAE